MKKKQNHLKVKLIGETEAFPNLKFRAIGYRVKRDYQNHKNTPISTQYPDKSVILVHEDAANDLHSFLVSCAGEEDCFIIPKSKEFYSPVFKIKKTAKKKRSSQIHRNIKMKMIKK